MESKMEQLEAVACKAGAGSTSHFFLGHYLSVERSIASSSRETWSEDGKDTALNYTLPFNLTALRPEQTHLHGF